MATHSSFLPGESQGQRSLAGYTAHTHTHFKYAGVWGWTWLNDSNTLSQSPSNKVWLNNCIQLTEPLNLREAGASGLTHSFTFLKLQRRESLGILCYNLTSAYFLTHTGWARREGVTSPLGMDQRARRLGRWPRTGLRLLRGPSEGSEKGVGSSRPRPSWLTPPLLPRAGPGGAGRHCPQVSRP